MRRLTSLENQVADLLIDLRKSEHMRVPSPNKIQRIVEMLEVEVWKSCARKKEAQPTIWQKDSLLQGLQGVLKYVLEN